MNKSENRFCVYLHTRPDTRDVFYVGIGSKKRARSRDGRNPFWKSILAKNNGKLEIDILCENQTWDSVCQIETRLIAWFGRRDLGTGVLVNLTSGGEGTHNVSEEAKRKMSRLGMKHTEEAKRKISLYLSTRVVSDATRQKMKHTASNRSPEYLEKQRVSHLGKKPTLGMKHTEEMKRKLSEKKKGIKQTPEHRINNISQRIYENGCFIEQVCLKTNVVIGRFVSIKAAFRSTRVDEKSIINNMKGIYKQAGGFQWRRNYDLSEIEDLIHRSYMN